MRARPILVFFAFVSVFRQQPETATGKTWRQQMEKNHGRCWCFGRHRGRRRRRFVEQAHKSTQNHTGIQTTTTTAKTSASFSSRLNTTRF